MELRIRQIDKPAFLRTKRRNKSLPAFIDNEASILCTTMGDEGWLDPHSTLRPNQENPY